MGSGWVSLKAALCWVPEGVPGEGESKILPSPLPLSLCILSRVSLRAI